MGKIPLSLKQSLAGKSILLMGGSGFLGKVFLSRLLCDLPETGRVFLLMRGKGRTDAWQRAEKMFNDSHAFRPLHEGPLDFQSTLHRKVEVLEGDVTLPLCGLDASKVATLKDNVDVVVNCSGLVDFNPKLDDAFKVNVYGALNAAELTEKLSASLIHVSTCYVAGTRQGWIEETVLTHEAPDGRMFDAETELVDIQNALASIQKMADSPETLRDYEETVQNRHKGEPSSAKTKRTVEVLKRKHLRNTLIEEGKRRAQHWGWTNTYTYTKALAEHLLASRHGKLSMVIFRPSIVESAHHFPFPGWNEGFNTSGPLAYLLGSWFRYLPVKFGNPFDIIPVDMGCQWPADFLCHLPAHTFGACGSGSKFGTESLHHRTGLRANLTQPQALPGHTQRFPHGTLCPFSMEDHSRRGQTHIFHSQLEQNQ